MPRPLRVARELSTEGKAVSDSKIVILLLIPLLLITVNNMMMCVIKNKLKIEMWIILMSNEAESS